MAMIKILLLSSLFLLSIESFAQEIKPTPEFIKQTTGKARDKLKYLARYRTSQSSMYLDTINRPLDSTPQLIDDLPDNSTKVFHIIRAYHPNLLNILEIGSGVFAWSRSILGRVPQLQIDSVDIKEDTLEIAEKYFGWVPTPRLNFYIQDGRDFINNTKNKYDAVVLDAFTDQAIPPFHLYTKETFSRIKDILKDTDGLLILHIFSSVSGGNSEILHSMVKTIKTSFPVVKLYKTYEHTDEQVLTILAMQKNKTPNLFNSDMVLLNQYETPFTENSTSMIYTDDYSPLETQAEKVYNDFVAKN